LAPIFPRVLNEKAQNLVEPPETFQTLQTKVESQNFPVPVVSVCLQSPMPKLGVPNKFPFQIPGGIGLKNPQNLLGKNL